MPLRAVAKALAFPVYLLNIIQNTVTYNKLFHKPVLNS
jgi:hypothetical protein